MIHNLRQQRTISQPTDVLGFGYWSGRDIHVTLRPAAPNTGVIFVRSDLSPEQAVPGLVQHRIEVPRRTTLVNNGVTVEMVEHIMAALAGLQIDNCEVSVDSAEMPGCDGSSQDFVNALLAAGIVEQDLLRSQLVITEPIRVGCEEGWVEARPAGSARMSIKYRLDYPENLSIGRQTLEIDVDADSFTRELAPARTFLLKEEAEWLRQQGLGTRVSYNDLLVFDEDGPIDNEMRFADECVRHKALDLIGDLSLAGCDLVGHFIAYRSGHRLNADLVRALLAECEVTEGLRKTA